MARKDLFAFAMAFMFCPRASTCASGLNAPVLADAGAAASVFAVSLPPEQAPKANAITNALKPMLIFFMLKILVYEEVKFFVHRRQ